MGLILRTEKSVLFVIPWGRHWIIGTTDTDWSLDRAHPAASEADIDYLLEHVNAVLEVPLGREDVEGVYAGLRPLLEGESDATSKLSREHAVGHPAPGLVVIAGGKYTTYRIMAKDAVDEAVFGMASRFDRKVVRRPGQRLGQRRVGSVLGWSQEQADVEIEHYRKRVEAERESQQMPDDETADAARLGAADVVPLS